ncbi:helix-turn-helix and ligand-binding sensor domain-containing protein [Muriicola soli]|uniref:LuxR family transcriptional regulator n=1 Tax=Muriicola soli TaxID=2507538 RepID=A0A411EB28_9FLAO|nr:triple tyrosine motif-containing protein [Muriicola soli]QBA64734.1 LuxR family transcriptional regulator [Muriicola soli]
MRVGFTVLTLCFSVMCFTQELPPIQNYAPSDYAAENQNWAISQAQDRHIYIANSKGLLGFNGASWEHYPLPNESIVRSVNALDGKVYTGGYMEFGYWEKDDLGILQYSSLSSTIKDDLLADEEFWNILRLDRYIVFQSLDRIYLYNIRDNSITWVETNTTTPKIFNVGQTLFFQKWGEGLYKIENTRAVLAYDFDILKKDEVVNIFERENDLLLLTRHNGFFTLREGGLKPWVTPANRLISQMSIYTAIRLKNKNLALGTISNGIILLNEEGTLQFQADQSSGLRNNTVLSIYEDLEGTLWLGLDNGISFLNLNSPYRIYQNLSGLTGSVYAVQRFNEILYLGTNQGLFYQNEASVSGFEMIPGTEGQVWSLAVRNNALFCGHHNGTFLIEGKKATQIANIPGTWKISSIPGNPDLLMQGNYEGLSILEFNQGKWRLRNKLQNFKHSSRYFEIQENDIFVNHEYKGLFRIKADNDFRAAISTEVDTVHRGVNSGLVKFREELLLANKAGIFKFNPEKDQFVKDSVLSRVFEEGKYISGKLITDDTSENLWAFTQENISYITQDNLDNSTIIQSIPLTETERRGIRGYESIYGPGDKGTYYLGSSNGFLKLNTETVSDRKFEVRLSKIALSVMGGSSSDYTLIAPQIEGEFRNKENNLQIWFYSPEYTALVKPRFQYRLSGLYEEWSTWSENTSVEFSNLPHGSYTFEVRGRAGNSSSANTVSYSFTIARPWYLTKLAFISYFLLAILASIAIHRTYRRYYRGHQQAIIAENKRELALAKAQNEKEIIRLKNKQLKKKFKNKNNELAASTLSIIRKNELLSRVKEQLLSTEEEQLTSVHQIVKIIDKSITRNDDWEMFMKAFNQADRKFLKKLKKVHPNLTPNDIKLCAYLRLNLSSKEIAPLLNISPRSVEIKRYRLRKKMNLSHDSNLTDYILTL